MSMRVTPDTPIYELLTVRWSPYCFADRPVSPAALYALFEAARWAPSSYNEQPWSYLVATKEQPEDFARLLSCLVSGNQSWAQYAPVLALGVYYAAFKRNGQPNPSAMHDLGLASANLTMEATARGLYVHQMAGIVPERVQELYALPEGYAALTALAIGYPGDPQQFPDSLKGRDATRRPRKPLQEFVFGGTWGQAANFLPQS